jgi:hypothetical protein
MICYAAGPEKEGHDEAVTAWNTRADDGELEELRKRPDASQVAQMVEGFRGVNVERVQTLLGGSIEEIKRAVELVKAGADGWQPIEKLKEALEFNNQVANDWVVSFASEFCGRDMVKETNQRIMREGGTLAYVAKANALAQEALSAPPTPIQESEK